MESIYQDFFLSANYFCANLKSVPDTRLSCYFSAMIAHGCWHLTLHGLWQSHVHYCQSTIRTVTITCTLLSVDYTDLTITCTLQSVDYTDCDNHMYITVSRLYGLWQSHVHYSQSTIWTVTIICTLQPVDYTDRDNNMYITVSRLYGPWQSHILILQPVDYTDRDNHMYITVSRLNGP